MSKSNLLSIGMAVLAASIAALGQEMAAGRVPLPEELRWVVPVLVAAISALTPRLEALGKEPKKAPRG